MISNKYYVHPYKAGSASAKALAQLLGGKVLRTEGSKFKPRLFKKVINWGSSHCPWPECLNNPIATRTFGNKLQAFQTWAVPEGPRLPQWSVDPSEALSWLSSSHVVCRHSLTGHSGVGIEIVEKGSQVESLPQAPLYTRYIPKDKEFRVHVFLGEIIDVQKKIRDKYKEPTTWKVRSYSNGFIYIRNGFGTPPDVLLQALRAYQISNLDFAAIDVVYNNKREEAYVLESNQAPGLQGESITIYAEAIKKYYENIY